MRQGRVALGIRRYEETPWRLRFLVMFCSYPPDILLSWSYMAPTRRRLCPLILGGAVDARWNAFRFKAIEAVSFNL